MNADRKKKLSLFDMVLKASPHPSFVFTSSQGVSMMNSKMESKMDSKMEGLKDCEDIEQIPKSFEKALDFDHPCVFPVSCGENAFFLVVLPMLSQKEEKEEDELLGRLDDNFRRIDNFIIDQIQSS